MCCIICSRISNGIVFGLDNTKTTTIVCSTYRVVLDDNAFKYRRFLVYNLVYIVFVQDIKAVDRVDIQNFV